MIFKVTIATVVREKQYIQEKMEKNKVDQRVLEVELEVKLVHTKEVKILKVFLVNRISKDLMKMIKQLWTVKTIVKLKVWNLDPNLIQFLVSKRNNLMRNPIFQSKIVFFQKHLLWERSKKWQNNLRKKQLLLKVLMMYKLMKHSKQKIKNSLNNQLNKSKNKKKILWHLFRKLNRWIQLNPNLAIWLVEHIFPSCKSN